MSEQNILNPSPSSSLNPDYTTPIKITDPQIISRFQARSGKPFFRRLAARGELFELVWTKRMFSDYQALRQWWKQYENDFFTFVDWDMNRYYTGMFADQPTAERAGNNQVTVTAQFVVVPTLPQYIYPSDWTHDAVFIEERANWPVPVGASAALNDLVKLTGVWDRRDLNYVVQSQAIGGAPWTIGGGATATLNAAIDPGGGSNTATQLTSSTTASSGTSQAFTAFAEIYTLSLYIFAGTSSQVGFGLWDTVAANWVTVNGSVLSGAGSGSNLGYYKVTGLSGAAYTRIAITSTAALVAGRTYQIIIYPFPTGGSALSIYADWAQIEVGSAATTYTATTTAAFPLVAPTPNVNYHGGFAYFDNGTIITDAAEWLYFGYGFQLWSPKGPAMGIVQVSLDKVAQGTVDLYAAALTASASIFTLLNVPLGTHRVTLNPTNTKNASSSGFIVAADAIQVMR